MLLDVVPPATAAPDNPLGPRHPVRREALERLAMKCVLDCFGASGALPTQKEMAQALECCERTVRDLKVWKAVHQVQKGRGRPSVASLTSELEAVLMPEDEQLKRLTREQTVQDDNHMPRPRQRKGL
jgi:hypothetical protein